MSDHHIQNRILLPCSSPGLPHLLRGRFDSHLPCPLPEQILKANLKRYTELAHLFVCVCKKQQHIFLLSWSNPPKLSLKRFLTVLLTPVPACSQQGKPEQSFKMQVKAVLFSTICDEDVF